ncbi:MAG: hypothetical protein ABI589_13750, partial [Burkholderiales bacterium]
MSVRGLPRLAYGDLALLTGRHEVVVAAQGCVSGFTLGGRDARCVWRTELPHPVTAIADWSDGVLVACVGEIHSVGPGGAEVLARTDGKVVDLKAAGGFIHAVVVRDDRLDATLLQIDPARRAIVSERSLRSAATRLSTDSAGGFLGLSDGTTFWMMATRPDDPCAGRDRPVEAPSDVSTEPHPAQSCCCPDKSGPTRPDPTRPENPPTSVADPAPPALSPCDPGQTGTPTPGGGRVVGDGSGVTYYPPGDTRARNPCRAHLFFEAVRVEAAGAYLLAADRDARNVAVLDAVDLGVIQRLQNRQGHVLLSHPAQPLLVFYDRGFKSWSTLRLDKVARDAIEIIPRTLEPALPLEVMTFTGSPVPESLKGQRAKTTGRIKVMVIPVLEPGQSFHDPDLPRLKKYLQRAAYNNVELFYRENSFGLLEYIDFDVHGVDLGSGGPIRLPKPISEYYNPAYVGAHVDLVKTGLSFPATIVFDGRERMTLEVKPQNGGRAASTLNVRFSAILASRKHDDFPVQIRFDGTETATISLKRPNGVAATLNLKFTAKSIDLEAGNLAAKRAELEAYFDAVVAAAELAAGLTSRLFSKPQVRRVDQDGATLGLLVTTLSHAAATGPRLEVSSIGYSGLNDPLGLKLAFAGRFDVNTGVAADRLTRYLDFVTVLAQED